MGKKNRGAAKGQSRPSASASSGDGPAMVADLLRLFVFVLLLVPLVVLAVPSCGICQVTGAVVLTTLWAVISAAVLPTGVPRIIATTVARSAVMFVASPFIAIWSLFWLLGFDFALYDIILWIVQSFITGVFLVIRPVGFFWRLTAALPLRTIKTATVVCVIPPLSSVLGIPFIAVWATLYSSGLDLAVFYFARLIAGLFITAVLFVGLIVFSIVSWIGRLVRFLFWLVVVPYGLWVVLPLRIIKRATFDSVLLPVAERLGIAPIIRRIGDAIRSPPTNNKGQPVATKSRRFISSRAVLLAGAGLLLLVATAVEAARTSRSGAASGAVAVAGAVATAAVAAASTAASGGSKHGNADALIQACVVVIAKECHAIKQESGGNDYLGDPPSGSRRPGLTAGDFNRVVNACCDDPHVRKAGKQKKMTSKKALRSWLEEEQPNGLYTIKRLKSIIKTTLLDSRTAFVKARNNLAKGLALAANNASTIKSFLQNAEELWTTGVVGDVEREEAKVEIRKVAKQHELGMGMTLADMLDLTDKEAASQIRQWVELLVPKPAGDSMLGRVRHWHWQNVVSRRIDSMIRIRVALLQMVELRMRGECFVEKLWCEDRERHMYGVFAMAPKVFNIQICPGDAKLWYGDYECYEGHKKTTNGNVMVDLINARVFDLSASHGHDGLAFCGWIMRELDMNEMERPGMFQAYIKGGDGNKENFSLHRFVHHIAHHHGVSIFAEGAMQNAGFDLGGRIYEHVLGYRPIGERSDTAIGRQIRASRRLSNRSDVDHAVGRDYRWTNGILHSWACSHRINICAIYVRVLENDWCYLLQKREYRGGVEVTDSYDDVAIDETYGSLRVGLFDGLTSYDPKEKDGGVVDEDCHEAIHLWAESLVGKAVRVLWGKDYACSNADIGWYNGKVLSYSREAKNGFTILFDDDGVKVQMDLDANTIELTGAKSLEDLANAMSDDDLFVHGEDPTVGSSSTVDSYPGPLEEIGNTPHQAFSAPPRPKKKQRTSLSGNAMNGEGLNLFNAFRRERD